MINYSWDSKTIASIWIGNNLENGEFNIIQSKHRTVSNHLEGKLVTIAELIKTVSLAAHLVKILGCGYIDIFERAECELDAAKKRATTMQRIHDISAKPLMRQLKDDFVKPPSFLLQTWAKAVSDAIVFVPH